MSDPITIDLDTFALSLVVSELQYRREKQWRIFSWSATLLTGIIGGLAALESQGAPKHLSSKFQLVVAAAVIALGSFAIFWLVLNGRQESIAKRRLSEFGSNADLHLLIGQSTPHLGYRLVVGALALVALVLLRVSVLA